MEATERSKILGALKRAFGGAEDANPGQEPLRVLLPRLDLPEPWQPSSTGSMVVFEGWPQTRPLFYVEETVVGEGGEPPRSNHTVLLDGVTWRGFSFAFDWSGSDPVRAVQLWMERFTAERS
jgi:hypothetical protein